MTLAEQQSQLIAALIEPWRTLEGNADLASQQAWPEHQYLRGLQAYRSNAGAIAQSVLASAYPAMLRLMGQEQFEGLAVHFWRLHPPVRGDLAQWGAGLDDFLRSIPELMANEPYLPDVASLEWALHAGKTAPDSEGSDPVPFAVINSDFAIVDLVGGKEWEGNSDQQGQRALVYRQGFKTNCMAISKNIDL